jgi:hypothetical protein
LHATGGCRTKPRLANSWFLAGCARKYDRPSCCRFVLGVGGEKSKAVAHLLLRAAYVNHAA